MMRRGRLRCAHCPSPLLLTCMLDTPACMLCRMPRGMALRLEGLSLLSLLLLLALKRMQ